MHPRPLSTRVLFVGLLFLVACVSLAPSLLPSSSESGAVSSCVPVLSVHAQILHEALTDVERAEARAEEEAAIHAGSLHRLGEAYKRVRAREGGRAQRAGTGRRSRPHRSLPRAPALVRIDPNSGEQEAFIPSTHQVRLPRRSSVTRSRVPEALLQHRRRQQQQRLAQQQMHRPQHGQQQHEATQQHDGGDEPERQQQRLETPHADQRQRQQAEEDQLQQQGQGQESQRSPRGRGRGRPHRDSRSLNSTDSSASQGSSRSPADGSRSEAVDASMVGRVGFSVGGGRLEDPPALAPPVDSESKSYFGKGVMNSLVDSRTLEPLATPSRASATAGALVVLVPILGIVAFYAAYSCVELRRRSVAINERAAKAHDAIINSGGRAKAAAAAAGGGAGAAGTAAAAGAKVKQSSQSRSSESNNEAAAEAAAARVRRAQGDDDFDAEWEGPLDDGL